MRLCLVVLASLATLPAHADVLTLGGTLNGRDILVELTQPQHGGVLGRYTYRDTGGDIPLTAVSHSDNNWIVAEEAVCGDADCELDDAGSVVRAPIAATWTLEYDAATYEAVGTRTTTGAKAKSTPLELYVIAWRSLDDDETVSAYALHDRSASFMYGDRKLDWPNAPYEMLLLDDPVGGPAPILGEPRQLGDATIRDLTDTRTKFAFPRVVSFAGGESVEAANAVLANRHYRMSLGALDCLALQYASYGIDSAMSIRGGHLGDFDGETVELTYASPLLLSWYQAGSLWCGGAHPYNHIDSYTVDLATGEPLDFSTILSSWVPRKWGAGRDDIATAAEVAAAPDSYNWGPSGELIDFVRARIPTEVFDEEQRELCASDAEMAEYLNLRFTPGPSVMFTMSGFPHVISVCNGDLFELPLAELTPFLTEDARRYFPDGGL